MGKKAKIESGLAFWCVPPRADLVRDLDRFRIDFEDRAGSVRPPLHLCSMLNVKIETMAMQTLEHNEHIYVSRVMYIRVIYLVSIPLLL